jgi:hypothetical protein
MKRCNKMPSIQRNRRAEHRRDFPVLATTDLSQSISVATSLFGRISIATEDSDTGGQICRQSGAT